MATVTLMHTFYHAQIVETDYQQYICIINRLPGTICGTLQHIFAPV